MGTELGARGVDLDPPLWSARAIDLTPGLIADVHREYAEAGATVHTTNTFRTKRRATPDWKALALEAVRIARVAVPAEHRIAGSISPLEDCYRPELSPRDPRAEHRELVELLAPRVDLFLCETFPHAGEAAIAVEEAVRTKVETWISFTAGPYGTLMTPEQMRDAARACIERGARAVLVNCVAADAILPYVKALANLGVPFGAYANSCETAALDPEDYAARARGWIEVGVTILGGCCGTGPAHIRALNAIG
jgi:S-methylmethionine-dependent homocysteine/selenocysteine methylase